MSFNWELMANMNQPADTRYPTLILDKECSWTGVNTNGHALTVRDWNVGIFLFDRPIRKDLAGDMDWQLNEVCAMDKPAQELVAFLRQANINVQAANALTWYDTTTDNVVGWRLELTLRLPYTANFCEALEKQFLNV